MNLGKYIGAFAFIFSFGKSCSEIVKIENGYLNSTESVSKNGRKFLEFRGIPFASPPVGKLRLRPPKPPQSWNGIRNSTQSPRCLQPDSVSAINPNVEGDEDCLYLNVFTPKSSDRGNDKFPVMVFIFGGGYQKGYADSYSPKYFMDRNVTLVTINYRLGALGFLSLVDDVIPGNYGFKDQVLALKWVQKNIEEFGGDANKVTIFGHSSGAASAHFHMLSPLSKGLFHGAILMSGSAFSPWAFYTQNYTKISAAALLYVTGCYFDNSTASLGCLEELPPEVFVRHNSRLFMWEFDPRILFRAAIENESTASEESIRFLDTRPNKKSYENDVPCILGHSSGDGLFVAKALFEHNGTGVKDLNDQYNFLIPLLTQYLFMSNDSEQYAQSGSTIKNKYFGDKKIGNETAKEVVKLITESLISFPLSKTVLTKKKSRSYMYLYDHISKNYSPENDLGVDHGDELSYLFYSKEKDEQMTSEDREISNKLIDFWVDFATYGDPNGKSEDKFWSPISEKHLGYLRIHSQDFSMEEGFFQENFEFWNSLPTGI